MGNYRGRIDIIADILQVAETHVRKTQIMYRANLSYTVLQRYLAELTEASLIEYKDDIQCYILTDKGREYIVLYKEYSKANKHIEKRLTTAQVKKRILDKLCTAHNCESKLLHRSRSTALKSKLKEDQCLS